LDKIEVENFRGLGTYSIQGFLDWTSITGPNSTSKSALITALSLLGSNQMHKVSDVPTYFSPEKVAPEDIPVRVKYRFRLTTPFLDLISDERLRGSLVLTHERFLTQLNHDQEQKGKLEMELHTLKSKPLIDILVDSLYRTIKESRMLSV
jgi:predicted ATP-dependent endonuclease of OLD family